MRILVSCAPGNDAAAARDTALLEHLRERARVPVLVTPHLYDIVDARPLREALQAGTGPIRLAARLFPRAAEWTLRFLADSRELEIRAFDRREYDDAGTMADALLAGDNGADGAWIDLRDRCGSDPSRWYPVIDFSRCRQCRQCAAFCLFGVYSVEAGGRVRVTHPEHCKPGCPACARVCPAGAILFPHCPDDAVVAGGEEGEPEGPCPLQDREGEGSDLDELIDRLEEMDL